MVLQYKKPFAGIQGHILNLHAQAAEPEEKRKRKWSLTSTHSSIMLASGNDTWFRLCAYERKHWALSLQNILPLQILLTFYLCKVFAFMYVGWHRNYKIVSFKAQFRLSIKDIIYLSENIGCNVA